MDIETHKTILATPLNWIKRLKSKHPFTKFKSGKHDFALDIQFNCERSYSSTN